MGNRKVIFCALFIVACIFIGCRSANIKEQYKYKGSGSEWKAEYTITKTGGAGSLKSKAGDLYNAVVKLSYIGNQDKIKNAKFLSFSCAAFECVYDTSYDLSKITDKLAFTGEMGFKSNGLKKREEPVEITLDLDGEEEHFELQLEK